MTSGINDKQSLNISINNIATIMFTVWVISPFLLRNTPIFVVLFIVGLWILSAYFEINQYRKKIKGINIVFIVLLWQIWEYYLRGIGYSTPTWGNYFSKSLFWFSIVIFIFHSNYAPEKAKKKIAICIFTIYIINLFDNLRLALIYPTASTEMNFPGGEKYLHMNVGGTMFIAMTLLVFCISITFALKHTNNKVKLLFWLLCSIQMYYIYLTARTTILIIIPIAIILNIVALIPVLRKQKLLLKLLMYLALPMICIFFVPIILESIMPYIRNVNVVDRLRDLTYFLRGQSISSQIEDSSLFQRVSLAKVSISTFFSSVKSFLIGVGNHNFQGYYMAFQTGIGGHSEFIDLLAKYGLIGAVFVFYIFKNVFRFIREQIKNEPYYNNMEIMITIYIIYSLLNNSFSPEIGIVLFMLFPYSQYLFVRNEKITESIKV